jgi:N-acetylneuraminic acid mutarotase
VIIAGGSDATQHYSDVLMLRYKNGKIETEKLPSLPEPIANACGIVIGSKLYIAGGIRSPAATQAEKNFWVLDLAQPATQRVWSSPGAWPGEGRMLAVAGTQEGAFYLISGAAISKQAGDSAVHRTFLKDAYKYTAGKGWVRIADLPQSVAAAPSPAFTTGQTHMLVFGGDHGKYFDQNARLQQKHPGFSSEVWMYNSITDSWSTIGDLITEKLANADSNPNAVPGRLLPLPVLSGTVTWCCQEAKCAPVPVLTGC